MLSHFTKNGQYPSYPEIGRELHITRQSVFEVVRRLVQLGEIPGQVTDHGIEYDYRNVPVIIPATSRDTHQPKPKKRSSAALDDLLGK